MLDFDPDWPDVIASQRGDDKAFERLLIRHQPSIRNFVHRMVGHAADAEEIAQETFVRAYFQMASFQPRSSFMAWLYAIARNLCRDHFRARAHKENLRTASLDTMQNMPNEPSSSPYEPNDRSEEVRAAILRLPTALRESLVLSAIEGFSHQEAGLRLGLSAKAVEVRAYRARKQLLRMLKKR